MKYFIRRSGSRLLGRFWSGNGGVVVLVNRRQVMQGLSGAAAAFVAPGAARAEQTTVNIQVSGDYRSYDPHKAIVSSVAESLFLLLDTLVTVEDDGATIRDGLAKEWTVSDDGLTYRFTLKDNLKFFNGKDLTAKSVEASFRRWQDPATKSINLVLMGPLNQVTALNEKTVEFTLTDPFLDFLIRLALPYAGIIDAEEALALGDQFAIATMNGSGPYGWDYWRSREARSFVRNPHYTWGTGVYTNKGPVKVDRVVMKVIPEENSRVAALLSGQSDISYRVPWNAIATIRKDPRFVVAQPREFGWLAFLGVKVHRPLMEPAVRKAMNLATDRGAIAETLYAGEADPARFPIKSSLEGYNKAIEPKLPKYDVAAAKKVLEDAGWRLGSDKVRVKNGVRLAPVLAAFGFWRDRVEAFQAMMAEIGIDLKLEIAEPAVQVGRILGKNDFDLWTYNASYQTVGDMLEKYFLTSETVSPYYYAPEQGKQISDLVVAGRKQNDRAKRDALFAQAQELIAEGNFFVPLVHERMVVVYNKAKVTGVKPHGTTGNGLYKCLDLAMVK